MEGTLIEGHVQSELSNGDSVLCIGEDTNYQIEDYLSDIYTSINTPIHPTDKLKQSIPFDCTSISSVETPSIHFTSGNNLLVLDIHQLPPYLISTLFKSLLTLTSVTSLIAIILFGAIAAIIAKKFWKVKNKRKSFTQLTRRRVLAKQKHRCARCNRILVVVDFDHKNGNRADSREVNCQALCPNCHAVKTRQKTVKSRV